MSNYYSKDSVVYYDGNFLKPDALHGNMYSQTLHYGNGIFEGIRSYKTRNGTIIYKARQHFERLKFGAEVMSLPFNYSIKHLTDITYELLELNNLQDSYIRPIITTGENMGLGSSQDTKLTIQCWKWGKLMGDKLLRVRTSSYQRPNPKSCVVEAKVSGHYVNSILARNEAAASGYDESILLDMNNNVAECSGANVFIEKDKKIITPPNGHILPGITRNTVIELCKASKIPIEERHFTMAEMKQADSAFFTGTAAEVVGLESVDDYQFRLSWQESLGCKLAKLYQNEVLDEGILIKN